MMRWALIITMVEERLLYGFIGEWFLRFKGYQRDEYSLGYLKEVWVGGSRVDVLAVRYELLTDRAWGWGGGCTQRSKVATREA